MSFCFGFRGKKTCTIRQFYVKKMQIDTASVLGVKQQTACKTV